MISWIIQRIFQARGDREDTRAYCGKLSGLVGICLNALLFLGKLLAGLISGSVSVMADAVNNLSDASSSLVTLVGFKLAEKPADDGHPYGHAEPDTHGNAYGHAEPDAHSNAYSHAEPDAYGHPNGYTYGHAHDYPEHAYKGRERSAGQHLVSGGAGTGRAGAAHDGPDPRAVQKEEKSHALLPPLPHRPAHARASAAGV